ncbi:hypothetical protein KBY77_16210, partial [Synechococcus sp. Cruz-7E5]|nr:hypothetical protein [Synechococcus sp. Cruz-7E5]
SSAPAGHPAHGVTATQPADPLAEAINRAWDGKPLEKPLTEYLREAGYAGRNGEDLVRSAFLTGKRSPLHLERGFHSTSDAQSLLLATGDRRLQDRHEEAPRGILELARIRQLADFREASVIDAGLVGSAKSIEEGGEITFGSLQSEDGKYRPKRYGLGLQFTFESLKNDDLGGIGAVIDEVSATMLEAEAAQLGELLHGTGGLGGTCPDGLALFHADHNNKPGAPVQMGVGGLASMVTLLRNQTSVGSRRLWLNPGYVLVGTDLETTALQLLSEAWSATDPDNTNPWKSLQLVVDPLVPVGYFYVVAAGNRKPFELGRVKGMPQLSMEDDFSTSGMKMKVEHAFGAACSDHRTIVRNQ